MDPAVVDVKQAGVLIPDPAIVCILSYIVHRIDVAC